MPEENLNIAYHTKRLITKALNKHKTIGQAAIELGVNERTLYNLMDEYKIIRVEKYIVKGESDYVRQVSKQKHP